MRRKIVVLMGNQSQSPKIPNERRSSDGSIRIQPATTKTEGNAWVSNNEKHYKEAFMKSLIVRFTLLTLAVGLSIAVAQAQTSQIAKFNIPFAFVVGNQTLSAGAYSVALTDTHVLVLRDDHGRSALVTTSRFDLPAPTGKPSVQFEVVHGQHILTGVKDGNDSGSRVLRTGTAGQHGSLR
jgi:hypothetical protein